MNLKEMLVEFSRQSGLLDQVEAWLTDAQRRIRESEIARAREEKRKLILSALSYNGLTKKDAERLLRLAEPGLLTGEESSHLLAVLHVAIDNVKKGPGVLAKLRLSHSKDNMSLFSDWLTLHHPNTSRRERLRLVKKSSWWPELVFALFTAELAVAQTLPRTGERARAPSYVAEEVVANAIRLSAASVHAICQRVRNENKSRLGELMTPIRVERFQRWLETGESLADEPG